MSPSFVCELCSVEFNRGEMFSKRQMFAGVTSVYDGNMILCQLVVRNNRRRSSGCYSSLNVLDGYESTGRLGANRDNQSGKRLNLGEEPFRRLMDIIKIK